jgi:hypothetical protein
VVAVFCSDHECFRPAITTSSSSRQKANLAARRDAIDMLKCSAGIDNGHTTTYHCSMKTAISLPDEMFKEIEEVTKECDCSRSQVFVMAVKEFLDRRKSEKLLEALNKAYEGPETPEETNARREAKEYHGKKVRTEPY